MKDRNRHALPALWVLAAALASSPAAAQTDEASQAAPEASSDGGLGEIVVTATRRATNLQDTPVAVSALDANLIERSAPRDLGELAAFVPNFSAATVTNFNAASFAIRGVGQNSIIVYFEPPVAVLVDDFVVSSVQTQLLDTFDIEQVEVLRGPQGTLFGKNTTGGAVTVRTKRPDLDSVGVEGRVMYGSYGTTRIQAAANVPIIPGQLAFRGVVGYEYSDGYYKNGACYGPVVAFVPSKFAGAEGCGDNENVGGKDVWNARAKLLWEPSPAFSALLQYEWIRDTSESVPGVNESLPGQLFDVLGVGAATPPGGDPLDYAGISNRNDALLFMEKGHRISVDGAYLNMDLDVGLGTFTSVSGYRKQESRLPSTYPNQAPIADDGEILSLFDASRDDDRTTWQQELRFASNLSGPFDFVAGGFYQKEKIDFCVNQILGFQDLVSPPTPYGTWNQTPYILCNAQKSRSVAAFAEGTYNFTDQLTLTVGARYTWEHKRWYGRQQVFIPQLTGGAGGINETLDASVFNYSQGVLQIVDKANEPTYRASLGWQATDDVFLYGTYSRGFKAGAFNDQIGGFAPFGADEAAFREAASATRPEKADSYEIGIKSELLDRRLRFNLTGFWVDYSDLQKQIVVPIEVNGLPFQLTRFFNAASATVKGIEAEATAVPVDGLTLRAVLGYQDGKYNDYVTPIPAGYDLTTAPLDRLPKWQWTLDGTYEIPMGGLKMLLNGNVAYTARNLSTQSIAASSENTYLNARTLVNASITLSDVDDEYYVRVIGRNLTDKRYAIGSQVVGGLWANSQYGPPRFVGVEAGVRFGSR
ncbi:TonB-dependent receptor [Sphingosinicella soli]|uniref:Iron complex outermembrane receptor protein n=1 Tax=Sphingosinicella soli TaxID=333708 RepID=A0A7W7B1Q0_9SPHN|nr:TonB-dependent receptor [Sphingosinicella soli]MBB4632386.1 iron complex outermembrane receptor protein [Sphingosinicella soli]